MNLEAVEQKVLAYLKQTTNPLVPVKTLLAHLDEDPETRGMSAKELEAFLKWHELFRVIEPGNVPAPSELTHMLLGSGPFAILDTRFPTEQQVMAQMAAQLDILIDSLIKALDEARAAGDQTRGREVMQLLTRAQRLKGKMMPGGERHHPNA